MTDVLKGIVSDDKEIIVNWQEIYNHPRKNLIHMALTDLGILSKEKDGRYILYSPVTNIFIGPLKGDREPFTQLFFVRERDAIKYNKMNRESSLEILKLSVIEGI